MAWDVSSGVTKTAWDVMSGVTKTAWDVLSGVANLCGMFCPGWQKMAWDVLSRDDLSGSQYQRYLNILFLGCLSGAVGSVDVWCSARWCCRGRGFEPRYRKLFTASIGSVDSLYPSV